MGVHRKTLHLSPFSSRPADDMSAAQSACAIAHWDARFRQGRVTMLKKTKPTQKLQSYHN